MDFYTRYKLNFRSKTFLFYPEKIILFYLFLSLYFVNNNYIILNLTYPTTFTYLFDSDQSSYSRRCTGVKNLHAAVAWAILQHFLGSRLLLKYIELKFTGTSQIKTDSYSVDLAAQLYPFYIGKPNSDPGRIGPTLY